MHDTRNIPNRKKWDFLLVSMTLRGYDAYLLVAKCVSETIPNCDFKLF